MQVKLQGTNFQGCLSRVKLAGAGIVCALLTLYTYVSRNQQPNSLERLPDAIETLMNRRNRILQKETGMNNGSWFSNYSENKILLILLI